MKYKLFLFYIFLTGLNTTNCIARNYTSMYGKEPVKDSIIYDINPNCLNCKEKEYNLKKDSDYYNVLNFSNRTIDKNGVPLWDDFVLHYKDKDFSDEYNSSPYSHSVNKENITLEEALNPSKPKINIWENKKLDRKQTITMFSQENHKETMYTENLSNLSYCPFETEFECETWKKKPQVNEIVTPKNPKLKKSKIEKILSRIKDSKGINQDDDVFEPLLDRYKILMRSARSCCTEGMIYKLKKAGANQKLIYKFLSDDANFYNIGNRCLMMTDQELDKRFSNTETANVVADVRNSCLCKGRNWFKSMLEPFVEIYNKDPNFKNLDFLYYYNDGLNRNITISINEDINNIINQLKACP